MSRRQNWHLSYNIGPALSFLSIVQMWEVGVSCGADWIERGREGRGGNRCAAATEAAFRLLCFSLLSDSPGERARTTLPLLIRSRWSYSSFSTSHNLTFGEERQLLPPTWPWCSWWGSWPWSLWCPASKPSTPRPTCVQQRGLLSISCNCRPFGQNRSLALKMIFIFTKWSEISRT